MEIEILNKKVTITEEKGLLTDSGWVGGWGEDSLFIAVYEHEDEDWYVAEYIHESVKDKFELFKTLIEKAMVATKHA